MKTLDKILKNKTTIPCLDYIAVKNGKATATNLEQALVMETSLSDGVYDKNNLPAKQFTLDDMPELPNNADLSKMKNIGRLSNLEIITLQKQVKSASNDTTRPALCGVMFEKTWAVATDGYILSATLHRLELSDKQIIVPSKTIEMLKTFIKDTNSGEIVVFVSDDESTIAFTTIAGNVTLYSKLIDAVYPDWKKILER